MVMDKDIKKVLDKLISDDEFIEALKNQDWETIETKMRELRGIYSYETICRNVINLCWNCDIPTDKINPDYLGEIIPYRFFSGKEMRHCFTTIKIPNNVKVIGEEAFSDSYYEQVTFSNGLLLINARAFTTITNLGPEVYLPDSLTGMGHAVFTWCGNLEKISIPNSIKELGKHLFYQCNKLKVIEFRGTLNEAEKLGLTDVKDTLYLNRPGPDVWLECTDGAITLKRFVD